MSAETLRKAAALMRERANHPDVSAGAWVASPHGDVHDDGSLWVCDSQSGETAEHIASWHPAVALAVADLLDQTARDWQLIDDGVIWSTAITWEATKFRALAVARAHLGGTA